MLSIEYLENLREDFPMLSSTMNGRPLIYLDSAATSLKPQSVIDAVSNYYSDEYGTVNRAVYELAANATLNYEKVRKKIATFINASSKDEIVFTSGTTESINLVAASYGGSILQPGDEILLSQLEHHANIVPWQLIAEKTGAKIVVIPADNQGRLLLEEYEKHLSSKTKVVGITHISNAIGIINPIKEMIAMAHAVGAKVLIDGAQSVPHIRIDIQDLDADFFVFSGHKIFGPTGVGVLYAKLELLDQMPPYQGGGDMIEKVTFEKTTFQPPPLKFEAGTPMIAQVIGLGEALNYIEMVGLSEIQEWEHSLFNHSIRLLQGVEGVHILGDTSQESSIVSFVVEDVHPLDIGTLLDLRGIAVRTGHHCAQPTLAHLGVSSTVRLSFSFYNRLKEIDLFVLNLQEVIQELR